MPWKECSKMDEKVKFVARLIDGEKMAPLCREFNISRKTGYQIWERYLRFGQEAFIEQKRTPYRYANKLPYQIEILILDLKKEHPQAKFIVHPECGCMSTSLPIADKVLSTEGMVRFARESESKEFIVATETGILHRMEQQNPQKKFYPANRKAVCEFMKMITLEKVLWSLEDLKYRVSVPDDMAEKAKLSIQRMLSVV
jgi:quinolinate synthase